MSSRPNVAGTFLAEEYGHFVLLCFLGDGHLCYSEVCGKITESITRKGVRAMAGTVLTLENLCKYYTGTQSVVVGLNNVNLSLSRGEFVAITGESGSGKSTLAHVLGGILPYEAGELLLEGNPTSHYDGTDWERYRRDYVSFISQSYGILPGCSVLTNVVSALRLSGMEKKEAAVAAEGILKQVELWDLRSRRAAKLSSGQKQRLSIARALAKPAPILIADEPTGNLDPENSAKVIELLAQAAKERLVILITHEFSEAEDLATRHIVIQGGRVVMDAALRPAYAPEAQTPPEKKSARQVLSPYVASLQLRGRPVWTALVTALFTLTAFAVFAFLGTFIVNLDDTFTRIYDDSAFPNGSMTRIVIGRVDQEPLTQADYDKIFSMEYVDAIEPEGYVTDIRYGYQEGVDYELSYNLTSESTEVGGLLDSWEQYISYDARLTDTAPFARTIPLLSGGREFLKDGRLPENLYEVILAGDSSQIGTTIRVFLQDTKNWAYGTMLPMEVTVVGVTDYGEGLYFHEDLGRIFNHLAVGGDRVYLFLPFYEEAPAQDDPACADWVPELTDEEFRCTPAMMSRFAQYEGWFFLDINKEGALDMPMTTSNAVRMTLDLDEALNPVTLSFDALTSVPTAEGAQTEKQLKFASFYPLILQVSAASFDRLTWAGDCVQASVTITDYAYTDRAIEALADGGFIAISPYQAGSTQQDSVLAQQRKQTLTICCAALVAVLLLQVILMRAMFHSQTEIYKLLSNIGLTSRPAKRSVFFQVLLFTVVGQILALVGVLICARLHLEQIVSVLRYLPPLQFALLALVHLAASMLCAAWIAHAMGKQVYPLGERQYDLALEDDGKEARK